MPRPVGSKNKATLAKMQAKTPATSAAAPTRMAKKLDTPISASIMDALQEFQDSLADTGEKVSALLTQISEEFEALKGVCAPGSEKSTKTVAKTSSKAAPVADEEEEDEPDFDSMTVAQLEEFIEENDLEVDLEDYKGLSKKRQAVADAYDELEDDEGEEEDEEEEEEDDEEEEDETVDEDEEEDDDWDEPKKPVRAGKAGRK